MLPGLLYAAERLFRVRRGNQTIYVRAVKWIPPCVAGGLELGLGRRDPCPS